jgi:hypothetical protein
MPTLLDISSEWFNVSFASEGFLHVQLNRFLPIMFSYSPEVEPGLNWTQVVDKSSINAFSEKYVTLTVLLRMPLTEMSIDSGEFMETPSMLWLLAMQATSEWSFSPPP